jgi:hypothetical protein
LKNINENEKLCGSNDQVGIDWTVDPEDTEIVIELDKYYDRIKEKNFIISK